MFSIVFIFTSDATNQDHLFIIHYILIIYIGLFRFESLSDAINRFEVAASLVSIPDSIYTSDGRWAIPFDYL